MPAWSMRKTTSLQLVVSFVLGGSSLTGCGETQVRAEAPAGERTVPVVVAPVQRQPITRAIHASGTLQPKRQHALSFKVGGVVTQVVVEEGARVKKGQVLARLDATEV